VYADFSNITDIGEKDGFALKNKVSYFTKDYKTLDSYDMQYFSYTPSLLYSDKQYSTELELNFDKLILNNTDYLQTMAITQRLSYAHDQSYKSVAHLKLMKKAFTQDAQKNLNANHYEVSYGLQHTLTPRSFILTSIIGIRERPDPINGTPSIYASYDESKLNFIHGEQFSNEYGMQLSIEFTKRKYKDYSSILLSVRKDEGFSTNLALNATLTNGFTLNTKVSYMKTRSNQPLFEYTKHTLSVGIGKQF
jgi:hypothetical protein